MVAGQITPAPAAVILKSCETLVKTGLWINNSKQLP